jgi:hypothetical protein
VGETEYRGARLGDQSADRLLRGEAVTVRFPGEPRVLPFHRRLADLEACPIPADAESLYEATVFAGDSNALEVRSLERSGPSRIPEVRAARAAFFEQPVFTARGIWDRNLFDGNPDTGFWPSKKYNIDQRVKRGCLRLDLGKLTEIDQIILRVPDEHSLQPLLKDEGNWVEVSSDLVTWRRLTYLAGTTMVINIPEPVRFLRFRAFPDRISEIEGYKHGRRLDRSGWRASNLFAHPRSMKPAGAWHAKIELTEWVEGSYLCVAVEGRHGEEGAYAGLKVDGIYVGCPDRAPSFPSNTWEYVNARRDRNYTYYVPVERSMIGKTIEVFVMGYDEKHTDIKPVVWVSAYPVPFESELLTLLR